MKALLTTISIGAILFCSSSMAKTYTFECPTPAVLVANVTAHGANPAVYFAQYTGWGDYNWMPPELALGSQLAFPISKVTFMWYSAVLFGQEIRCVYHLNSATLQLRLTPSYFYSNALVGIDGDPHRIQLEQ